MQGLFQKSCYDKFKTKGLAKLNFIILSYLNLNLKVSSNRKDHIMWLLEFLSPDFQVTDGKRFHCEVALIENNKAYNRLFKRLPSSRKEINGFIFDNSTYKLLQWSENRRWLVLFDEEMKIYYIVNFKRTRVFILCQTHSSYGVRIALMRVLREYAMNYEHPEGGYFLHSAAFNYQGNGIMIAGAKHSAKTSLLMYFLLNLSSQFISNDRVCLYFESLGPVIKGMPTIITIPQNTLSLLSKGGVCLPIHNYHHWYSLAELDSMQGFRRGATNGNFTITPRQFSKLIDTECCSKASLSAIMFPRILKGYSGLVLKRLTKQEAVRKLQDVRLAKKENQTKSFFHLPSSMVTSPQVRCSYDAFANRCASEIVCFDCIVGYEAYEKTKAGNLMYQLLEER